MFEGVSWGWLHFNCKSFIFTVLLFEPDSLVREKTVHWRHDNFHLLTSMFFTVIKDTNVYGSWKSCHFQTAPGNSLDGTHCLKEPPSCSCSFPWVFIRINYYSSTTHSFFKLAISFTLTTGKSVSSHTSAQRLRNVGCFICHVPLIHQPRGRKCFTSTTWFASGEPSKLFFHKHSYHCHNFGAEFFTFPPAH